MHKNGHKFGPLFMRFIIFPRRFLFAAGNKCAGEFIFEIRVSFSRTPPPRPRMQGCYCALDIRRCLRGNTRRARRRTKLYIVVLHPQQTWRRTEYKIHQYEHFITLYPLLQQKKYFVYKSKMIFKTVIHKAQGDPQNREKNTSALLCSDQRNFLFD